MWAAVEGDWQIRRNRKNFLMVWVYLFLRLHFSGPLTTFQFW